MTIHKIIGIPFGQCFLKSLAELLIKQSPNPFDLAKTLVILPTKRALLNLNEIFQTEIKSDHPLMLPRIIALADIESENPLLLSKIDDLPSSINPLKRLGLFIQLVLKLPNYTPNRALKAAQGLIHLIDEAETTGIDLENLKSLAVTDYAEHWQETLNFLKIVTDYWPSILTDLGVIEPQARTRESLRALAQNWRENPPNHPIIIAGTTGTVPATAELMKTVLALPQGQVILPGLDTIAFNEDLPLTHPQHTLSNLLKFLETNKNDILILKDKTPLENSRYQLLISSMNNKELTLPSSFSPEYWPQMVECDLVSEEAKIIALMMRHYLEISQRTISLVSPNQHLCHLVETELERWNLTPNTSSGRPLANSVVGGFVLLVADLFSAPTISQLLVVLKHPLCFKANRQQHLENVRILEKNILRKFKLEITELEAVISEKLPSLSIWFQEILDIINPLFSSSNGHFFKDLLSLHKQTCLSLTGDNSETSPLWGQSDGKAVQTFFDSLFNESDHFPPLNQKNYPSFLASLMQQDDKLRDNEGIGSRIRILGALEARLSHCDVMILGGLNENSWPPSIDPDPWLSRSMRQQLGLPSLERRLGLSAHDFSSCFYAPHLLLTRSRIDQGTPTIPSRWWRRLEVVEKKNADIIKNTSQLPWQAWAKSLSPKLDPISYDPPSPRPPVQSRPTRFSVTEIETLMRDPYGIYAKQCLKLSPLLSLDEELGGADKGQIIHKILESYLKSYGAENNRIDELLTLAKPYFDKNPVTRIFWWHRFEQIATWFLNELCHNPAKTYLTEQNGQLTLSHLHFTFTVKAIADRLDILTDDHLRIIDYKTGNPPSIKDIKNGYSPQLSLEALMADQGGFDIKALPEEIAIWHLKGGEPAGKISRLEITSEFLKETETGLLNLLSTFMNSETPYLACPVPEKAPTFNPYAHLERLSEWQQ
ncbi:MAG: double-strand break repair protein AddB [Alphaproteobacteria bacterium]|nr:double-strand break repair protein AddB [Alphaproteobacteria bacterium]